MSNESDKSISSDSRDAPVETDISKRWEQGIEHDPRSEELVRAIADLDFKYGSDSFCFKIGGDGDNGEHLMYLLDIYYELQEEGQKKRYSEQLKSWIDRTRDLDEIPFENVGAHVCPHCNQATMSDPCGHCGLRRSFLP